MSKRRGVFFGWRVASVAFLVAVVAWGIGFYGPSIYVPVLHLTRGWSVSLISAAVTTHFLVSAAVVARLSDLHRHYGIAAITRVGVVALSVGVVGWAVATTPWQLFAAAIVTGTGFAATSGAAIHAMIQPWFVRQRPAALSLVLTGASVGGIVFGPLWAASISRLGFPLAAVSVAVVSLVILWPLAGRFLRPTPEHFHLLPDGDSVSAAAASGIRAQRREGSPRLRRTQVLRDRRFATMAAASALGLFAQVGLLVHLVSYLTPLLGQSAAATALSFTTMCAIVGRLVLGVFIGSMDRRLAFAANGLVQGSGVVLLALGTTPITLFLGCVFFGFGVGNLIVVPPLIVQAEFDPADVGFVVALATAINQALFALAPAAFGLLHDLTNNYSAAFTVALAMQIASAALVLAWRHGRHGAADVQFEPGAPSTGYRTSDG